MTSTEICNLALKRLKRPITFQSAVDTVVREKLKDSAPAPDILAFLRFMRG